MQRLKLFSARSFSDATLGEMGQNEQGISPPHHKRLGPVAEYN